MMHIMGICLAVWLVPGPAAAAPVEGRDEVSVAAVQIMGYDKVGKAPAGLDAVAVLLPYIERAGRDKADLLVFPEYHLGRIRVPGPETERLAEAIRREGIYVIVGSWECLDGAAFANTALLFGRDGNIVGTYRKTHAAVDQYDESRTPWTAQPPGHDLDWFIAHDPEWKMERGDELPVFTLDFGKVAILTCYDGWFPEPWRVVSLEGAEIYRVDQPAGADRWRTTWFEVPCSTTRCTWSPRTKPTARVR